MSLFSKIFFSAVTLLISSAAFASSLSLTDLKSGDVLQGKEIVTGKNCSLEITGTGDKTISGIISVDGNRYVDVKMKHTFSLQSMYVGIYTSEKGLDNAGEDYWNNVEGYFTKNRFSGEIRFQVVRIRWGVHDYHANDPSIDCREMLLK